MKQKIVLIVAVVVGLLAAGLARAYLNARAAEYDRMTAEFKRGNRMIYAIVFGSDVPSGTVLTDEVLAYNKVPAAGLNGQALGEADLPLVLGRRTARSHRRGDILFWSDVEGGNPRSAGLAAAVRKYMRAVTISTSGAAAVGGMVRPADHVDVVGTFSFPDPADPSGRRTKVYTYTILQNVLVLATGRETAKSRPADELFGGRPDAYGNVTLEVTPREAEMLVFAEQMKGRLVLTLRNGKDVSYEQELPKVDLDRIGAEIEELNRRRQQGQFEPAPLRRPAAGAAGRR